MDESFSKVIIMMMIMLYPLITIGGYNNLGPVKLAVFGCTVVVCFWGQVYLCFLNCYKQGRVCLNREVFRQILRKWNTADKLFALFFLSQIISLLRAEDKGNAFYGTQTDGVGFMFYCLVCMMYMTFRLERQKLSEDVLAKVISYALIAGDILIGFAVLQFFGYDILHLIRKEFAQDIIATDFLSTLGNTGLFGAYVDMLFPVALLSFLNENSRNRKTGFVSILFCLCGVLCANTDATYLGMSVGIITAFFYAEKTRRMFIRLIILVPIVWLTVECFGICYTNAPEVRRLSALTQVVVFGESDSVTSEELADSYLDFQDNWGNGRLALWKKAARIYKDEYSFPDKVVGRGQGTIWNLIVTYMPEELDGEYIYTDVHSEYFSILLTTGALGLISYLAILVYSFWFGAGKKILGPSIAAYAVVAMFGIYQPVTIPMMWFAICMSELFQTMIL